jgi:hypothetical protein
MLTNTWGLATNRFSDCSYRKIEFMGNTRRVKPTRLRVEQGRISTHECSGSGHGCYLDRPGAVSILLCLYI